MPRSRTIPARIYSTAEYREGYWAGARAARVHRPDSSPFLSHDPRDLGWSDALYDAWSARRVELRRAATRTESAAVHDPTHQLV